MHPKKSIDNREALFGSVPQKCVDSRKKNNLIFGNYIESVALIQIRMVLDDH